MKQYPHEDSERSRAPQSPQRRRLIRAGLASPAVLVLASQTVQAANCKSPSGFSVSGNLSRSGGLGCTEGMSRSPSFWAGNLTAKGTYQGSVIKPTALFSTVFTIPMGSGYADDTFANVLNSGNRQDRALFAAVYLEARVSSGAGGYPDKDAVLLMWNGLNSGIGYPVPNSTAPNWDKTAILKYLLYLTGQTPS